MAEDLHHHARVDALSDEERGAGVPQVMEADRVEGRPLEMGLEPVAQVAGIDRPPDRIGEDEIPRLPLSVRPCAQTLLQLPGAMRAELHRYLGRQGQGATAARRLRLDQARLLRIDPLEGHADVERAGVEVHVAPAQAEHLALPQPKGEGDRIERLQSCDCKGAESGRVCWHQDHVVAAWHRTPAMRAARHLSATALLNQGRKAAAMVNTYRTRCGRPLQDDVITLVASRSEWRRRAALAPLPFPIAQVSPLAA